MRLNVAKRRLTRVASGDGNGMGRRNAVSELKRELILNAARNIFEADGLEGASLRAIGPTPCLRQRG